jgi:hypothetical protein
VREGQHQGKGSGRQGGGTDQQPPERHVVTVSRMVDWGGQRSSPPNKVLLRALGAIVIPTSNPLIFTTLSNRYQYKKGKL